MDSETLVVVGDCHGKLQRIAGRLKTKGAGVKFSHRELRKALEVRGATMRELADALASELALELLMEGDRNGRKSEQKRKIAA